MKCAKIANAHEFIDKLEKGYDAVKWKRGQFVRGKDKDWY